MQVITAFSLNTGRLSYLKIQIGCDSRNMEIVVLQLIFDKENPIVRVFPLVQLRPKVWNISTAKELFAQDCVV